MGNFSMPQAGFKPISLELDSPTELVMVLYFRFGTGYLHTIRSVFLFNGFSETVEGKHNHSYHLHCTLP